MLKSILKGAAVIAASLFIGLMGITIGAYIGGNFAEGFVFNSVRGYEAAGQLGFLAGFVLGLVLSIFLLFKRSKRGDPL